MKTMKQTLLALLSAILCLTAAHAQVNLNEPNWEEMMRDPSISFYEIQAKFNSYWANRPV